MVVPQRTSNERFDGGSRGSPAARQDGDDQVDDMALQLLPRLVIPWFQCLWGNTRTLILKSPKTPNIFKERRKKRNRGSVQGKNFAKCFLKQQFLPSKSVCVECKRNNQPRKAVRDV